MITKIFYKNRFLYELVKVGSNAVIYKQITPNRTIAYEVHKIRLRSKRSVCGVKLNTTNRLPLDEDFGKWAWSCFTLEKALQKFSELEGKFKR